MNNIQHVIFDLDNTLWDFNGNSKRILAEIYTQFELEKKGIRDFEKFHTQYKFRNEYLWQDYAFGKVSREEVRLNRFFITLNDFGVNSYKLASDAADHYVMHTRNQKDLLPNALEMLDYLKTKYQLHIITNGFEEVQFFKLNNTGLMQYFSAVVTAESAQALKPDKKIFDHAVQLINTKPEHCLYIGDSPDADGLGSLNAGMHFIWFNPENKTNQNNFKMVNGLMELVGML